ncbi:MAG: DUF5060 domain-containing protein [Capsulimonadaceae bacterium]|nr:DUF5060 domain-containing protein [Capsulimonadaceae bacterium]
MKNQLHAAIVFGLLLSLGQIANAAPALTKADPNTTAVPQYGLFELTLDLSGTYANPFDPDQIDAGADFTSPDGRVIHVNAFYYQAYTRALNDRGAEVLTESGAPAWKIRFAADKPGVWRYAVTAKDPSGETTLPVSTFRVAASDNPGFVRVSKRNPAAFAFDGEKPLFTVGEDMCWGGRDETFSYDKWMPKLHAAGGNWVRIWSWPHHYGLEWADTGQFHGKGFRGLGAYNLANAWRLDTIFDTARANGIYCLLALGYQGEFGVREDYFKGNALWAINPYNKANGGPCEKPEDFWTDPLAQKYYERRLRYIGARYGWRTEIQSWELWNEVDAPAPWVRTMAQALKGAGPFAGHPADPFGRLVTTTYGNDEVWKIPEIDWSQTHIYGSGDVPDLTPAIAADAWAHQKYGKPHQTSEFGIDWHKADAPYDKDGKAVDFHNGLWSSAMSGNAGTAMLWWWDSYVDPQNLYGQFTAISRFAAKIPWTSGPWTPIKTDPATIAVKTETFTDLTLPAQSPWGKAPATEYQIDPARPDSKKTYPGFLFSPGKPDLRSPLRFIADYPVAGKFVVHVYQVSQSSQLRLLVDGKEAATFALDANPPKDPAVTPEYKTTEFNSVYSIYQAIFDRDYAIDVPAGKHVIDLEVVKGDWLSVSYYKLTNYRGSHYANIRVLGIARNRTALLWVQNTNSNWKNVYDGTPIPAIHNARTAIHDLPSGNYSIEFVDTLTGATTGKAAAHATEEDGLPLAIPDLATDIAVRIKGI